MYVQIGSWDGDTSFIQTSLGTTRRASCSHIKGQTEYRTVVLAGDLQVQLRTRHEGREQGKVCPSRLSLVANCELRRRWTSRINPIYHTSNLNRPGMAWHGDEGPGKEIGVVTQYLFDNLMPQYRAGKTM